MFFKNPSPKDPCRISSAVSGILSVLVLLGAFLQAPPAHAAQKLIELFDDWEAYTATEAGNKVCYIGSEPKKSEGNYTRRGRTFILVAHRPNDQEEGIISITAGYVFKKDSTVTVTIGDKNFKLFTANENAFAEEGEDPALVQAMIRGAEMVVKGTSSRGTPTTDVYSLKGFTAAYKAISRACGF